jgi:hypothetical protein
MPRSHEHPADTYERQRIAECTAFSVWFRKSPYEVIREDAATRDQAQQIADRMNAEHGKHGRRAIIYGIHPRGGAICIGDAYPTAAQRAARPMKSMILAAVAAAGLLIPAARAEVRTISQYGAWTTIAGTVNDGTWMCGVKVTGPDKVFIVKWFKKDDSLVIHLHKDSWRIPAGTRLHMTVQFDQDVPWEGIGTAHPNGGGLVELDIDTPQRFLTRLAQANSMVVSFPDGTETPWIAKMSGSQVAVLRMLSCMRDSTQFATQPYGRQPPVAPATPPTQPFAGSAAPSAPPTPPFSRPAPVRTPTDDRSI